MPKHPRTKPVSVPTTRQTERAPSGPLVRVGLRGPEAVVATPTVERQDHRPDPAGRDPDRQDRLPVTQPGPAKAPDQRGDHQDPEAPQDDGNDAEREAGTRCDSSHDASLGWFGMLHG